MSLSARAGYAHGLDGTQVALAAAREALSRLDRASPAAALIFASQTFPISSVMAGVSGPLGSTPIWGFSTTSPRLFPQTGQRPGQGVVVVLIAGDELRASVHSCPGFSTDPAACSGLLASSLPGDPWLRQAILFASGGVQTGAEEFCAALPQDLPALVGSLSCNEVSHAGQIGGSASGVDLAVWMRLSGRVRLGIGASHAWKPVGEYFHVTRATGPWITALDQRLPIEIYSSLFGGEPAAWGQPPLRSLGRLYPLEIEPEPGSPRHISLPLWFEPDGRLRLNQTVRAGSTANLLVGSQAGCLESTRQAALQAVTDLGPARPFLGLIFADTAWEMQLEARAGEELQAVQQVLRDQYPDQEFPLAAAYSLGQIAGQPARALNGHIVVALLGETPD